MLPTMQDRLRHIGCRSVPAADGLKSCGLAFHRRKKREWEQVQNALSRKREADFREEPKRQRDADTARLKALGGRPRDAEEQREWRRLFVDDPGRNAEFFEKRMWEKRANAEPA